MLDGHDQELLREHGEMAATMKDYKQFKASWRSEVIGIIRSLLAPFKETQDQVKEQHKLLDGEGGEMGVIGKTNTLWEERLERRRFRRKTISLIISGFIVQTAVILYSIFSVMGQ